MANRNFSNGGKIYAMETKPVLVQMSFQVDATAALGISNLKGPLVSNVFMHSTHATPSTLPQANPAAGYIVIQLQDNYNRLLSGIEAIIQSPLSGSSLLVASAGLTVGLPYVITILGSTTTAAWHALGVPAGVSPAVGVSFVAAATSAVGTGAVQVPAAAGAGILSMDIVGSPNLSVAPAPSANQGFGAQLILRCLKDSSSDAPVIGTPADGSIISILMYMSDSSVTVQGS